MAKDDELVAAKKAYRSAKEVGNRREEARWANVIGDILKNRGEYVEALKWLRIDFKISSEYLLEKDLLPTCQSVGELYLRLQDFENALYYQVLFLIFRYSVFLSAIDFRLGVNWMESSHTI